MSNWIDVRDGLPNEDEAVFVMGRPYHDKPLMKSVAVMDYQGRFFEVDNIFGWVESYENANCDKMNELECVSHWMPMPGCLYDRDQTDKYDIEKGNAVKGFVNSMIGAFESGFVDDNKLTLAELYRVAQHHIKDNYGVEIPNMRDVWGEVLYLACKDGAS